ncbi:MAG: 30S ribosomal protein S6 [Planctomycetaceae bacterium]
MAAVTYEGMFLLDSNKYASNPQGTTGEVLGMLEKIGAQVLATRPWQDGKLAYAVEGQRKGLHFLTYFTADSLKVHELDRMVKLNESVLRHLVIKLPEKLIAPMVDMANGKGEVITTFHDSDSSPLAEAVPAVAAIDAGV